MIVLPRAMARSFRSVLRRSVMAASPRGPAPPVLVIAGAEGLTLRAVWDEVGLTYRVAIDHAGSGQIAFPGELLARFEGAGNESVTLNMLLPNKAQASWDEQGVPKVAEFEPIDPAKITSLPSATRRLTPMPANFLKTLDELCRTVSREPNRYALQKIQLRGKAGQIVASDGRQMLIQGGLPLPFGVDILVPSLPVFGAKELTGAEPVSLGRSDGRLIIRAGSWCFDLKIDTESRYPNIDQVIPSSQNPTNLTFGEADAEYLIGAIPQLPSAEDDIPFVTLDLGREVVVRARSEKAAHEVLLYDSTVTGPALQVSINRQYLVRALQMDFRSLEVHAPNKPLVARDGDRLMVFAALDPKTVVKPSSDMVRLTASRSNIAPVPTAVKQNGVSAAPLTERNTPMATPPNGTNGHQVPTSDTFDPILEAEALKTALQEALNRSNRLIGGLRQFRKQHKAVASAMASLRQFQLTP
jgi:hypothetical protein